MIRYLRYAFLAVLGLCLIALALANREPVTLKLLTDEMGALIGVQGAVTLPLFIVIFLGIVAGILIGFVWEWFREHKHRAEAARQRREKERLEGQVKAMRQSGTEKKDDILALLDG